MKDSVVTEGHLYTNGTEVVHVIKRFTFLSFAKVSYIAVPGSITMVDYEDEFLRKYPTIVERVEIVEE